MTGCNPHTDKFKNRLKDSRINTNNITYRVKNDKYIICKDSIYLSLTEDQIFELHHLLNEIIHEENLIKL